MIVLDTTVLSDLMHSQTQARVVDWLDRQPAESIWRTALNVCGQRKAPGVKTVSPKRSAALKWTVFKVISTSARPFKAVSSTISKEPGRGRCARSRRSPPRRSDRCAPTRVVPPGVRQGLARCCRPLAESGYAFAATTDRFRHRPGAARRHPSARTLAVNRPITDVAPELTALPTDLFDGLIGQ